MDVNIQQMNSRVQVTDDREVDRLADAVLARLRRQDGSERQRREETRIQNSVAGTQDESGS